MQVDLEVAMVKLKISDLSEPTDLVLFWLAWQVRSVMPGESVFWCMGLMCSQ